MNQEHSETQIRFERIGETYYGAWCRYHPEAAVEAGVAGHAHRLTPFSEDERGALVCLNDELITSLDELDAQGLDADQRLDYQLMYGAALLENEQLLDVEPTRPDPGRLLPVNAIHQLLIRPVEDFPGALLARLCAIPAHLAAAREHLAPLAAAVPTPWLRSAVTGARRGAEFMRDLPAHPKLARGAEMAGLAPALDGAARALVAYADFLERTIAPQAQGGFACGEVRFEHLLRRRHFLDIDAAALRALGESLFAETQAELEAACRDLGGDVATLTRRIQADVPAAPDLLSVYRTQMQAAHDFVAAHHLVTLPTATHLDVVETPVFLRHQIPFAAYSEPSPNDPAQQGYYYVTPPADAAELAEHHFAGLMHTCVHEAWPGHHLQFVTANLRPVARTLPRLVNPSATLYEGWALYCEQLMHEQGFLDRPESRFILLKDRLWRALRIVLDVDLHTRGLSLDAAADRMVEHLGFPRAMAIADLTWYSRSPTVPMGYATGWRLINALREGQRQRGQEFSLADFHDALLSQGSAALPLVIRRAFGDDAWRGARRRVFGGAGGVTV